MEDLEPQAEFELLPEATQRLVRTVDGLDDEALGAPSGLPDWTRGHVVAHLALNAEALAGVLEGVIEGRADHHVRLRRGPRQRHRRAGRRQADGAARPLHGRHHAG